MTARVVDRRYDDPVDALWLACAERAGLRVVRSGDVYASYDGAGTLTIGAPADLDADDSLAQMILHELCHALVIGPGATARVDWGLENVDDRDLVHEHACHRLQAALADPHGLRRFMAVTTEWRPYYDALPADPLGDGDDPAIPLAREGWRRAMVGPWATPIADALSATAAIAQAVRPSAPEGSLWRDVPALHPLGGPVSAAADAQCGTCAWAKMLGPGKVVLRCSMRRRGAAVPPRVDGDWPGCERWERPLVDDDCADCGACCREGFHQVPVARRAPLVAAHPELVAPDGDGGLCVPRPGGRCAALAPGEPYRCAVYALRPRHCRELAVGSEGCRVARQRVGLSWRRWGRG